MIAKDHRDPRMCADRVRELFNYDRDTGNFTRKTSRNGSPAGKIVGAPNTAGHIQLRVDGYLYVAHRLAWLYVHGCWPSDEIDHINGDKSDNRLCNLREATRSQNQINKSNRRRYPLPRGVFQAGRRFQAQIAEGGRFKHLGMFGTAEEAHSAWLTAANLRDREFLPDRYKL